MEWRRGFLALTGPPSLGQELEVGEAQSLQVAESFCLPGVSPCFLPPIFLSPSHIHSLPSPLQRGREAGPIPILEEKEGLPPPPRHWVVEDKGTVGDAGSTLFFREQEARESPVTRVGVGTASLQPSQEEGLGHRAWHRVGTWKVVNKWP